MLNEDVKHMSEFSTSTSLYLWRDTVMERQCDVIHGIKWSPVTFTNLESRFKFSDARNLSISQHHLEIYYVFCPPISISTIQSYVCPLTTTSVAYLIRSIVQRHSTLRSCKFWHPDTSILERTETCTSDFGLRIYRFWPHEYRCPVAEKSLQVLCALSATAEHLVWYGLCKLGGNADTHAFRI